MKATGRAELIHDVEGWLDSVQALTSAGHGDLGGTNEEYLTLLGDFFSSLPGRRFRRDGRSRLWVLDLEFIVPPAEALNDQRESGMPRAELA